ncbi:hypothetical protein ACFCV8_18150 [Streptomyces sp. NPDC056347]|uniref:hypothetical protein n=1 Tax=Streptomyces sp. NPDC056347 TaxID=3345790 RepID=UPI0035D7B6FF
MNDVTPQVGAADENAAATAAPATTAPARPGRARRVARTALPVVTVAVAVVLAAAYTKSTVDGADRTTETRLWEEPAHKPGKDPAGDVARGRASTGLSKLLLPVPSGYRLGPDKGELGNDGERSGSSATAAMKQNARGLAGKKRRAYEERIDKLRIEGIAVRTYTDDGNTMMVSTELTRMKDKKAVRSLHAFRTGLWESLGIFRQGPKVKEHTRNAKCYELTEGSGDDLATLNCFAYDDEVSITLTASGSKPFDKSAVAELLKDQLNHIASPGEYV